MSTTLTRRFAAIGARVVVVERNLREPRIDIRTDRAGEFFDLALPVDRPVETAVVDTRPRDRHLLLMLRDGDRKAKFLCGMDERHWFVAAIPEQARGVSGVPEAMQALQPPPVQTAVQRLKRDERLRRRNRGYLRQGEWFFLPRPDLVVDTAHVRRNEPLTRGWGQAHMLAEATRLGGTPVYVHRNRAPLDPWAYSQMLRREGSQSGWRLMMRDPELYARGSVRHPDHQTLELRGWHLVLMNTEHQAAAMRHVAFLD